MTSKILFFTLLGLVIALYGSAQPALSAGPPYFETVDTIDLSLDAAGGLRGVLLTSSGASARGVAIDLIGQNGQVLATQPSAGDGSFLFANLRPGLYVLRSPHDVRVCRLWAGGTAPPSAAKELLMVNEATTVRGQLHAIPWSYAVPIGLVVGGVVAYRVSQKTAS